MSRGAGATSRFVVVSESGRPVSRHKTVTAAAKRIARDGAIGRWQIKREGVLRLVDIHGADRAAADAILYPALDSDASPRKEHDA